VTLFRLDAAERVTSVFPVIEDDINDEAPADPGAGDAPDGSAREGPQGENEDA